MVASANEMTGMVGSANEMTRAMVYEGVSVVSYRVEVTSVM